MKLKSYWPVGFLVTAWPAFAETVLPEVTVNATLDAQEQKRMASAAKTIIEQKDIQATDASTFLYPFI